jgi:hypothetical protein
MNGNTTIYYIGGSKGGVGKSFFPLRSDRLSVDILSFIRDI